MVTAETEIQPSLHRSAAEFDSFDSLADMVTIVDIVDIAAAAAAAVVGAADAVETAGIVLGIAVDLRDYNMAVVGVAAKYAP